MCTIVYMKKRTYSKYTLEAINLLAAQIKLGRKERGWTEEETAERAGISRTTLRKIEQGDPGCALGLVFEVATLVGIKLFDDPVPIRTQLQHVEDKIALLPQRIRIPEVDDDF